MRFFARVVSSRPVFLLLISVLLLTLSTAPTWAFPRTIIDGLGNEIHLETKPQRIFSTGLAMDNILLEIVDPQRVVGVTRFAQQSSGSYVAHRVQDHMTIVDALNSEQVIATNPDLVLVAFWSEADPVRQIRDLGYRVYTFTGFSTVQDALKNIAIIGELTGEEEKAQALIDDFWQKQREIEDKLKSVDRPLVLSWDDWNTTTGIDTSIHDIIEMAGGTNAAAVHGIEGWQMIDAEAVLQMNPQVIISPSSQEHAASILADPALATVDAVREGRVYYIPHSEALNHHFILAIEYLARKLHPEAFGQ